MPRSRAGTSRRPGRWQSAAVSRSPALPFPSRHRFKALRLVFAPRLPPDEHLARYRLADLFLDTDPFGAHTTASDALWAGLPVLTCPGETFASRVAASLLNAVHLPELVAETTNEYESLSVEPATNPERLAQVRAKLADRLSTAPVFDTPTLTRHVEAAYEKIHRRYRAGQPPEHLDLAA